MSKICRRSFISLALGAVLAPKGMGEAVSLDRRYSNSLLRVSFPRPANWHVQSLMQIEIALDEMNLQMEDIASVEFKEGCDRPLLVMTKHEEPCARANPALAFYHAGQEFEAGTNPIAFLSESLEEQSQLFSEFEILAEPRKVEISGTPSAISDFSLRYCDAQGIDEIIGVRAIFMNRNGELLRFDVSSPIGEIDTEFRVLDRLCNGLTL